MEVSLAVKRLRENARVPTYATAGAAGLDLYACVAAPLELGPGAIERVPSGVAVAIPPGFVGLVRDRSGLAVRGLHTLAGVIDSDYRGEVLIAMHNAARQPQMIRPGDRIAQILVLPCPRARVDEVDELPSTARGARGFGSTGR